MILKLKKKHFIFIFSLSNNLIYTINYYKDIKTLNIGFIIQKELINKKINFCRCSRSIKFLNIFETFFSQFFFALFY